MIPSASNAEKHFLKEKETQALRDNVSHPMLYSNGCRERTSTESHNYYPLFIINLKNLKEMLEWATWTPEEEQPGGGKSQGKGSGEMVPGDPEGPRVDE